MKKSVLVSWKWFLSIIVFVFLFGIFTSAMGEGLIVASIPNTMNQAWVNMAKGIELECAKLGYSFLLIDPKDNAAKQMSDTEDAITKKPKFLLFTGVDKGTATLIDMAKKKGIPTITLSRDYGGDVVAFAGEDNVALGEGIIKWYADYVKGAPSKIIVITGTPGSASSGDREKGVDNMLAKYPNIKEVARQSGYYRREKTLPVVEDLLQRHTDVQAILGFNDEIAMGALAAAKAQNRKLVITGIDGNDDALQAIAAGELTMSAVYDDVEMGRKGVQLADMALKGQTVPKKYIMHPDYVTKENVQKFLKK